MNGAHARPWTEELEDYDEHFGRKEDGERWTRPDLPAPMTANSHVAAHSHPDDDPYAHPAEYYEDPVNVPQEFIDKLHDTKAAPEPPKPTLVLIVVGSFNWTNRGAVTDALHDIWRQHGEPNVQLVTSGCPAGAEAFARELAAGFDWTHMALRDEELDKVQSALVLGFLTADDPVYDPGYEAAKVVDWLKGRFWTRIYRETTVRQVSPWSRR